MHAMREVKMRCSERKIGRHQGNGRGAANGEREKERERDGKCNS